MRSVFDHLFPTLSRHFPDILAGAKFKGNDVTKTFIDMAVIDGNIWEQIDEAEKFILSNIKRAAWFEAGKMERTEHFEYPFDVIREALINAICQGLQIIWKCSSENI